MHLQTRRTCDFHVSSIAILLAAIGLTALTSRDRRAIAREVDNALGRGVNARFRISLHGDDVLVPVFVDDTCYLFALDTGSKDTWFDNLLRPHLGKPLRNVTVKVPEGHQRADSFRAPRLVLGGEQLDLAEVLCADLKPYRDASGYDTNGILGMDVLKHKIFQIDFDQGELSFHETAPENAGEPVRITISPQQLPYVSLTVSGHGETPFVIDTFYVAGCGSVEETILARLVRQSGARAVQTANFVTFSRTVKWQVVNVPNIALGSFRHTGLHFAAGTKNLLGLGYLSRYVVTLDFPHETMYLKPGERFNEPCRQDLSGLHVLRPAGVTSVHSVDEGSPAERAGFKAGDIVERIDGRDSKSYTMFQIRDMLCRPGKYLFSIRREGAGRLIDFRCEEPHAMPIERRLPGESAAARSDICTKPR